MVLIGSWILLISLTGYAFVAATSIAVRAYAGRTNCRAELALASCGLWNFLILIPIHLLGVTNHLTSKTVAIGAFFTFTIALLASFFRTEKTAHLRRIRAALISFARLPYDALAHAVGARSLVTVAVLYVIALWIWTGYLTYLLPSEGWDAIWYHETMIGYAIQNHGYRPADLVMGYIQQANGYPRNCEMTSLWFVLFTDRTFIEIPNSLAIIPMLLAVYATAIRYGSSKVAAMGWACAVATMPGAALQLRTTYIDLHVAAILLGAIFFATKPNMQLRDGWMASVWLSLLVGAKSMAIVWVPALALVAIALLPWRRKRFAAFATMLGSAVVVALWGSVTYVRNWFLFKNPVFPIAINNERFGIHWPGPIQSDGVIFSKSLSQTLADMMAPPNPGLDFPDTRQFGYGFAFPSILLLLAGIAFTVAVIVFFLQCAGLTRRQSNGNVGNLLLVILIMIYTLVTSPCLWASRYNLHVSAGIAYLVHWFAHKLRSVRFDDAASLLATFSHMIGLYWAAPGFEVNWAKAQQIARVPAQQRATESIMNWTIAAPTATARDRELTPDTHSFFTAGVNFPSLLWNEQFSNQIYYLPTESPKEALSVLERNQASWVAVRQGEALDKLLRAHPQRWEFIGKFDRDSNAFRSRPHATPSPSHD